MPQGEYDHKFDCQKQGCFDEKRERTWVQYMPGADENIFKMAGNKYLGEKDKAGKKK